MQCRLILFLTFLLSTVTFGQKDSSSIILDNVEILSKQAGFKKVGLYDEVPEDDYNIRGFTQLSIFENDLTDEFWLSKGTRCISGVLKGKSNSNFLSLTWNKDLDGCDWVGFGFGWDGWTGKDIGYVVDTLALEIQVRSTAEAFTNLPWAFGVEDYSGQQAWLGYNTSFLQAKNISQEWTKVQIPLSLFPFEENDVDLTSVKQLLIQVFAEGIVEIKKVQLVPFSKKMKQEVVATSVVSGLVIDGDLGDWNTEFMTIQGGHKFAVSYTKNSLFFGFKIIDDTPRVNNNLEGNLWKGDAIEIAYATNFVANKKRKFLLLSDQHIGINCGDSAYAWDWKEDEKITEIKCEFGILPDGYSVELEIPFMALHGVDLIAGKELGLEIAIDLNEGNVRKEQQRWNSVFSEGFNTSPSKWGLLLLK